MSRGLGHGTRLNLDLSPLSGLIIRRPPHLVYLRWNVDVGYGTLSCLYRSLIFRIHNHHVRRRHIAK